MNKINCYIYTPYIQLDQLLKYSGIIQTGGEIKNLFETKNILVNDIKCTEKRKKIYPGYKIKINSELEIIVLFEENRL